MQGRHLFARAVTQQNRQAIGYLRGAGQAGEMGLRPVGLTIKAIRHRLLAERQAKYADRVLPFKPKGGK